MNLVNHIDQVQVGLGLTNLKYYLNVGDPTLCYK